jgi:hypothetical protein
MDPTSADKEERAMEEEIKKMLPGIARICGQEARNFNMGGIFISQQATGLAWLRKVALMVIVHQMLMESEKKLALNGDTEAMESMKTWPRGRTYVYGVGFEEGPRTVQQPFFKGRVIDSTIAQSGTHRELSGNRSFELTDMLDLPLQGNPLYDATTVVEGPKYSVVDRNTGALETPANELVDEPGMTPDEFPAMGNDDLMMNDLQIQQFMVLYPAIGNIVDSLKRIDNGKGQGLGKRYFKHASWIVKQHNLKKEGK